MGGTHFCLKKTYLKRCKMWWKKCMLSLCICVRFQTFACQSVSKTILFAGANIYEKIKIGYRVIRDFFFGLELGVYTCLTPTLYLHSLKLFFLRAIPHLEEPEIVLSSSNRVASKRNKFNIVKLSPVKTKISREMIILVFFQSKVQQNLALAIWLSSAWLWRYNTKQE